MEQVKIIIQKMITLMGFSDYSVSLEEESNKLTIFINEGDWFKKWLPKVINDFSQLSRTLTTKAKLPHLFIDINNYRKERENIIAELARAAARKTVVTKSAVTLPAMNSYERRLIHTELATRPDIATESEGEGKERRVVIRPL